jgi:DNA-binding response OmpR family regulator
MNQTKARTKVLIVDDEPNIVLALDFLMQKQGLTTAQAFNGEQALDVVKTFQPDLVILDVMMPGIDGFEVAKRIRRVVKNDYISIIFLTAKGTSKDKMKGYSTGGDVYLTKPFDNDQLSNMVVEMLQYG